MAERPSFAQTFRGFAGDFAAFAGLRGLAAAALMALGALLEGVGLAFLIPLLALLTGQGGGRFQRAANHALAQVGAETRGERLALLLAAFFAILVLRAVVLTLRDRRLSALQLAFVAHLRLRLIRALGAASWQDIAGLRHARITHALGTDTQRVASATQLMMQSAVAAVMLAAQWLLTLAIVPLMAGIALVLLGLSVVTLLPTLRRAVVMGREVGKANLSIVHTATQLLGGLKLAIAQNMQRAFTAEFEETANALTARQLAFQQRQSLFRVATSTASALAGILVLLLGLWLDLPIATLLVALAIMIRMSGPALTLQQNAQQLANTLPSHSALAALLDELERESIAPPAGQAALAGTIRFDGVDYGYAGAGDAGVRGVTLAIAPGEVVGVVGASGAGKTTFVDLLSGLLSPERGAITIGGVALDPGNARGWRDRAAYVTQDPYLLNDSIRRNLAWGIESIDDAELWHALALAQADALVRRAGGLDTIVAERGSRLSGGERQRIALARAFVRRPVLLILDEATNAIDAATEHAILGAVLAQRPAPTLLIVAHRPETLRLCRRLLTFDAGRLVGDRAT